MLFEQIAARMKRVSIFSQRLLGRRDNRQFIIFDLDQLNRLLGRQLVARHHNSHRVTMMTHVIGQQIPVGDIKLGRIKRVRVSRSREQEAWHVFISKNCVDTGIGSSLADIDALDLAMRNRAADVFGKTHAEHRQIVGIARLASYFCLRINAVEWGAYRHRASDEKLAERRSAIRKTIPTWKLTQGTDGIKVIIFSGTFCVVRAQSGFQGFGTAPLVSSL